MVYSASSARTLLEGQGDGTTYLVKYLAYGAVGLVVMHLLSRHGLENVRRYTPFFLLFAFVLLLLVLIPGFGAEDQRRAPLARRGAAAVPALGDHEARADPARRGGALRATQDRAQPQDRRRRRSSASAAPPCC